MKSIFVKALKQKFLDSTLSQENWQSRAFQFFMGDFHDVMYATKNISSFNLYNKNVCISHNCLFFFVVFVHYLSRKKNPAV